MEKKTYNVTTKWAVDHAGDDIASDLTLEEALAEAKKLRQYKDDDEIIISENEGDVGTYYSLPEFLKKLSH